MTTPSTRRFLSKYNPISKTSQTHCVRMSFGFFQRFQVLFIILPQTDFRSAPRSLILGNQDEGEKSPAMYDKNDIYFSTANGPISSPNTPFDRVFILNVTDIYLWHLVGCFSYPRSVFQNKRKSFLFISFLVILGFIFDLVLNRNGYAIYKVRIGSIVFRV